VYPPEPLRQLMTRAWLPRREEAAVPHPASAARRERRQRLAAAFPGELLVVPTASVKSRANDTSYSFRPGTAMTWLAGSQETHAVLVIHPDGHDVLYQLPPDSREESTWYVSSEGERCEGARPTLADTAARLLLEVAPRGDLLALKGRTARVVRGTDPDVEELFVSDPDRDAELLCWIDEARLVKDDWELEQLQEAVDATVRGFEDVVRELWQAVATSERWLEGTFFRRARVEGHDVGYRSICASGPRACTVHYTRNDGAVRPGELLLLDMGVENRELYTADITRTLPVSGVFTDAQRWAYSLVYEAQEAALRELRPGVAFDVPYDAAMRVLVAGLVELGLIPGDEVIARDDMRHRRWTAHRISHMLGLDVHDCAAARDHAYLDGVYQEGMVLTVEPGLYFAEDDALVPEHLRGMGIRLEDDVVVTAEGYRMLSAALPRSAEEIEAWMAELVSA